MNLRVDDIRKYFIDKNQKEEYVIDKSGCKMLELYNANFIADKPSIFGTVDRNYIEREMEWYDKQSLNVNDIPGGPPKIWKEVADKYGQINSNYGWCIYHNDNWNQFDFVIHELETNPHSRRAQMIYTRPSMTWEYKEDGMSDYMCTNTVQYLIRNDELVTIVNMRSNDVIYGYKNDFAWQEEVTTRVADRIGITIGDIHWNVGSLHIYERHFELIK